MDLERFDRELYEIYVRCCSLLNCENSGFDRENRATLLKILEIDILAMNDFELIIKLVVLFVVLVFNQLLRLVYLKRNPMRK